MTKIKDLSTALSVFEDAAKKHAEATIKGDYQTANKNYNKVINVVNYLKDQGNINELLQYLSNDVIGVRLAAATFLLPTYEKQGMDVLETISQSSDFFSFTAETTLSEWRKGNLKL